MCSLQTRIANERGAVLIQVAVCMLGLLAFTSFVVDYGIMWAARGQAQNAADAGALAGALTLEGDPTAGTAARDAARSFVRANPVWGEALADTDITVSWPLPSRCPNPDSTSFSCIRVDVSRGGRDAQNTQHTNYLPVFFANLVGVQQQGVVATATAMVRSGNATNCLRPWIVADGWRELSSPPNQQFDVGVDVYTPPSPGPGTGYTTAMIGQSITLTAGDPNSAVAPSNYYEADLGGSGASNYEANIKQCSGILKEINALSPPSCPLGAADPGCVNLSNGRKPQANIDGAQYLISQDPSATIDSSGVVHGSCAPNCANYPGRVTSPRIVPVALFDPAAYMNGAHQSGNLNMPIVNIMAFFVQSVVASGQNKGNIIGVLAGDASLFVSGGGTAGPSASFLKFTALVR